MTLPLIDHLSARLQLRATLGAEVSGQMDGVIEQRVVAGRTGQATEGVTGTDAQIDLSGPLSDADREALASDVLSLEFDGVLPDGAYFVLVESYDASDPAMTFDRPPVVSFTVGERLKSRLPMTAPAPRLQPSRTVRRSRRFAPSPVSDDGTRHPTPTPDPAEVPDDGTQRPTPDPAPLPIPDGATTRPAPVPRPAPARGPDGGSAAPGPDDGTNGPPPTSGDGPVAPSPTMARRRRAGVPRIRATRAAASRSVPGELGWHLSWAAP